MVPETVTVGDLIQLRDPDSVLVRRALFGRDIHAYFGKVQVRPDPDGGCNAGLLQDGPDHGHGHDVRRMDALPARFGPVKVKVGRAVDEGFIYRVNMNILGSRIAQENRIDFCRDLLIERHTGRGYDVIDPAPGPEFIVPDRPFRFKQAGAGRHADRLERGGDGETDRLVGAGRVRDKEPDLQRVQTPGDSFHRSIVGLHIHSYKTAGRQIV